MKTKVRIYGKESSEEMDLTTVLFSFFGGLGLFLFGIKSMSEGLQAVAGDRLRVILEKGTKTPLRGVLTGAIVTGLIQSSSGTTGPSGWTR